MNFQKTFSLSFSPGVAGTSHHVFSPVNSELLSDQGAAQSILRPFFAQSLVCGKQSLNILKLNKLKWILTVADNFNCSALLGTRGGRLPSLLCRYRTMSLSMEQERTWCVSFQIWPITTSHMHFSTFSLLLLKDAGGAEVWAPGNPEKQAGLRGLMLVPGTSLGVDSRSALGVSLDYLKSDAFNFALLLHHECHILGIISVSTFPFLRMRGFQELQHLSGYRRYFSNVTLKNFPGGPEAKTLYSQGSRANFSPWLGN